MKIARVLAISVLCIIPNLSAQAAKGSVVKVGGVECCRYTADGIPQTKYCTSKGVECKSDGTCSVSLSGVVYQGTQGPSGMSPGKLDKSAGKANRHSN